MRPPILCDICTEAFAREVEYQCDKTYQHHGSAASFHEAKRIGCHVCSVIWEVARGDPSDLKWDFRKARDLNVTYEFSSSQSSLYFRLDADDGKTASLTSTLRQLHQISPSLHGDPGEANPVVSQTDTSLSRVSRALYWSAHWLQNCLENHATCRSTLLSNGRPHMLPTRVLDLRGYNNGIVALRVTDGSEVGYYMTLSHRWGVVNEPPRLLKANLKGLQEGIIPSSLPSSFLDAIIVAKHLGVDWLWIDSLCIIQDSEEDWRYESSLMGKVYQNSLCNLAATGASDSYGGLFHEDSVVSSSLFLNLNIKRDDADAEKIFPSHSYSNSAQVYRVEPWSIWSRKIEDSELNQRGWVVQERILAPRTLHFTRTEVLWECIENIASESVPDSVSEYAVTHYALIKPALVSLQKHSPAQRLDIKLEDEVREGWRQLAHEYIKSLLTKESDRLIAISGISKLIKQATGDQYLAGNWRSTLFTDLVWYNMRDGERLARTRPLNAPTWSWASVKPYAYVSFYSHPPPDRPRPVPLAEFSAFDADAYTDDDTGQLRSSFLHLRGRVFPGPGETYRGLPGEDFALDINGLRFVSGTLHLDEDDLAEADSTALGLRYFPVLASYDWLYSGKIQINVLLLIRRQVEEAFERAGLLYMVSDALVTEAEFQQFVKLYNDTERDLITLG